jgi:hypothetical protein
MDAMKDSLQISFGKAKEFLQSYLHPGNISSIKKIA